MAAPSLVTSRDAQSDGRGGNGGRAAVDVQVLQFEGRRERMDLIVQDGHEVLVKDLLLLVGHDQESAVGKIELLSRRADSRACEAIE